MRSQALPVPRRVLAVPLVRASLITLAAVGVAIVVTRLAMGPSSAEMVDLGLLLTASGVISVAAYASAIGWIRGRPLAGATGRLAAVAWFSGALALGNVTITAAFMFLSGHDLTLLAILIGFALTVSSALAMVVARSITEPLGALTAAIDQFELDGSRPTPLEHGPDEVGQLAAAFDRMSDRLAAATRQRAQADQGRRQLIAAISHDLRTPIASARLRVEALEDDILEPSARAEYLAGVGADLNRLNRLIDDLFELARIEAGDVQLRRSPTDLAVLTAEAVEGVRAMADARSVSLTTRSEDGIPPIEIDGWCIERALRNLLENAVSHSEPGGCVYLDVQGAEGSVELLVTDEGPGVPATQAAQIFEPFFRGDEARQRQSGGAGLGLAIARGLFEAHGGSLSLDRSWKRGARFRGALPLSEPV